VKEFNSGNCSITNFSKKLWKARALQVFYWRKIYRANNIMIAPKQTRTELAQTDHQKRTQQNNVTS